MQKNENNMNKLIIQLCKNIYERYRSMCQLIPKIK